MSEGLYFSPLIQGSLLITVVSFCCLQNIPENVKFVGMTSPNRKPSNSVETEEMISWSLFPSPPTQCVGLTSACRDHDIQRVVDVHQARRLAWHWTAYQKGKWQMVYFKVLKHRVRAAFPAAVRYPYLNKCLPSSCSKRQQVMLDCVHHTSKHEPERLTLARFMI